MSTEKKEGKNLGHRLVIDNSVAALAGFSLAWLITPMDAAVMESMSGKNTLTGSLKSSAKQIFSSPFTYLKSPQYKYVVGTYIGTYSAKNSTDTFCKYTKQSAEASAVWKFWFVTAVNGGLSVFWKDPGLARLFGKSSAKMPTITYASWMTRDFIHILGTN